MVPKRDLNVTLNKLFNRNKLRAPRTFECAARKSLDFSPTGGARHSSTSGRGVRLHARPFSSRLQERSVVTLFGGRRSINMVNGRIPSVFSKTYVTPRRPYEKARLDQELKIIGEYGLRNKREVWRVKYTLAKIRKAARELLTLEEKDPKRLFEGNALLRRLVRIGVLDESRMKLDYVLGLKIEDFLERRLQTQVFKLGLAKSIHHARVLIRQRHIRVRKQVVNIPSFIVRLDSQKHIDFSTKSPFGSGRAGRVKRKNMRKGTSGAAAEEEED